MKWTLVNGDGLGMATTRKFMVEFAGGDKILLWPSRKYIGDFSQASSQTVFQNSGASTCRMIATCRFQSRGWDSGTNPEQSGDSDAGYLKCECDANGLPASLTPATNPSVPGALTTKIHRFKFKSRSVQFWP